jgi:hypothetical protein
MLAVNPRSPVPSWRGPLATMPWKTSADDPADRVDQRALPGQQRLEAVVGAYEAEQRCRGGRRHDQPPHHAAGVALDSAEAEPDPAVEQDHRHRQRHQRLEQRRGSTTLVRLPVAKPTGSSTMIAGIRGLLASTWEPTASAMVSPMPSRTSSVVTATAY